MMFQWGKKKSEKKDSHDNNLSTADRTDQARRAEEDYDTIDQQRQELSNPYHNADHAWKELDRGWQEYMEIYRNRSQSKYFRILVP